MKRTVINFRHVMSWVVFLVWAGVFGNYYFSGNYVEFLNPQFGWLMAAGFILCFVYFVVFLLSGPETSSCCGHDHSHLHHHGPSFLRIFILLIPVLFVLNFDSWQLGSFAFDKRAVGLTRTGGINGDEQQKGNELVSTKTAPPTKIKDSSLELNLLEIHQGFETLVGKKVITQGKFVSETPGIPKDSWVIFRFVIVCCAADAQPVAVMIKGERPVGVADESWVQVEGVLQSVEVNGQMAVAIVAEKVSPIAAPKNPYMLPTYR